MKIRPNPFLRSIAALSAAVITTGTTCAANRYWDADVAANLQSGTGAWDEATTALWSSATAGSNPLVVFNSGDDAFFQTAGANAVTLDGAVTAKSVTQTTNGTATTISGVGTLTISTGNITNSGNTAFNLNQSALVLGATGTISASTAINIGAAISGASGIGFNKTGNAALTLPGSNSLTGPMTVNAGQLFFNGTSGTPFGTGSINLNGAGGALNFGSGAVGLSIVPNATGTTAITGGTQSGSQLSFANTACINLTRFDTSSPLTYTYGSGSGTVLNRVGKGVLVFMDNTTATPVNLGIDGGNNFIVNGTAPTVTNGMVPAYFIGARNGGGGDSTFLTYDNTFGFTPVTYDVTNSLSGWDNTKKVTISSGTVTTDSAVYALRTTGAITISPGVTVTIGNGGSDPAALLAYNNVSGGTLAFGASEGLIFTGGSNSTISSSITGSGGLTKSQYLGTNGQLTLTGTNGYSGTTTVNTGRLNIGNAGTTGDLGNSSQVVLGAGASLNFNRSDAVSYSGNITGSGSLIKSAANTLTLSGTNTVTSIGQSTAGSMIDINGGKTSILQSGAQQSWGGSAVDHKVKVTGGELYANDASALVNRIEVDGGTLTIGSAANESGMYWAVGLTAPGEVFTLKNGTVNFNAAKTGGYLRGFRLQANIANQTISGSQTGGNFTVMGGAATGNVFTVGINTASYNATSSYTLSGGVLDLKGQNGTSQGHLQINADAGGTSTTTFTLSGTGKLISRFSPSSAGGIAGGANTDAKQVLSLQGGTLVAGRIDAANLRGPNLGDTAGTIVNNGSTIAPGDSGTSGKTTVNGNLTITTGSLAFDIGGTAASTAWQDAAGPGKHDKLAAIGTGTVVLGGTLNVSLIAPYQPDNADIFYIIDGVDVSGTFTNLTGGRIILSGGDSFAVTIEPTSVFLSDYETAPVGGDDYSTWATDNGIDGEPFNGDFDNDGISNGVEYALGKNPTVSSQPAGVLTGNTITFNKGTEAMANNDVTWIIETSTTLEAGFWTTEVTHDTDNVETSISYLFTPGSPAKKFARLKVEQVVAP